MKAEKGITKFEAKINILTQNISSSHLELNIDFTLHDLLLSSYALIGKLNGVSEFIPEIKSIVHMYLIKEALCSNKLDGLDMSLTDYFKYKYFLKNDEDKNESFNKLETYITALDSSLKTIESSSISYTLVMELIRMIYGVEIKNPLILNLCKFIQEDSRIPYLIKAGMVHSNLFNIESPYQEINSQISRVIIVLYICKVGFLSKPLLPLSEYFLNYQKEYFERLSNLDEKDGQEKWSKFFLSGVITTANKSIQTLTKLKKLYENDLEKVSSLGRTSGKGLLLLKSLFKKPLVSVKDVEHITHLKNPNALALIARLIELGILSEITGQRRNRIFGYVNYLSLF